MTFTHDFYIGFKSIDRNLDLSNNGILTIFTDIAGMHSEFCGDNFFKSTSRWIVLAYKVHVIKRPRFTSTVSVVTWSSKIDNLTAEREFEIRDKSGNLLICAKSKWVSIHAETKRIERINQTKMELYKSEPNKTNFDDSTYGKITEPNSHTGWTIVTVDDKWIDMNNHLNNTYYLDIAQLILPETLQAKTSDMNFEIMYKKEIYNNSTLKCFYLDKENEIIVTIKSENEETLHSIIRFYK